MSNYKYEGYGVIRDLKDDIPYHTDDIVDLLEEKDTHIAELKKQLEEKDADIIALDTDNYSFKQQIDNLRQQLKTQPAEIVEKIKEQLYSKARSITGTSVNCVRLYDIRQILDTILKEYQK